MVPYTTKRYDDVRATTQKAEGYDVTTMKTIEATRKYYPNKSKYYGQRSLNLDQSLNLDHLAYEPNPKWEAMPGQQNWVEKRYKETTKEQKYNALNEAMNMSDVFKNSKNSNSSKIINWMIKNMPDGKQTIIVL